MKGSIFTDLLLVLVSFLSIAALVTALAGVPTLVLFARLNKILEF
jgi:hypothetical protein